jgi:ATP-dependent helicase/nuclease subunit B
LPLYGLGQNEKDLAAVAFARVRSANCAFVGVAREKDLLPGIPGFSEHRALQEAGIGEWRLLLEGWKTSLLKLSEEFAGGQAAVAPIDRTRACDRCDLHPLCRINEQVRDKSGEE